MKFAMKLIPNFLVYKRVNKGAWRNLKISEAKAKQLK